MARRKLKPLSVSQYTIDDAPILDEDVLVSYEVVSFFTNVPVNKTINILVDKAFKNDWFNSTYDLRLQKHQLTQLLKVASTNQLFQFEGQLYSDGVAMGSPLGPLLANTFICHLEEKLSKDDLLPQLYNVMSMIHCQVPKPFLKWAIDLVSYVTMFSHFRPCVFL